MSRTQRGSTFSVFNELMKKIDRGRILFHVTIWFTALLFNVVIFSTTINDSSVDKYLEFFRDNYPLWISYITIFYINFWILIPRFLFAKRYVSYALLLITMLSLFSFCTTSYKIFSIRENYRELILNESKRTDIMVYRKNLNIANIEKRINNSYELKYYNPVHSFNLSYTYSMVLIIIISVGITTNNKLRAREKMMEEIHRQKIESELAYLKQQINPHFLFNALNSIYSLVLPHSDKGSDIVLKLSSILRYMLYETDLRRVSLNKEIEIMRSYVELQTLRCSDSADIEFTTKGDFGMYSVEPLLMLPFIENAFKYGINNIDQTVIKIMVECTHDTLIFKINNRILSEKVSEKHSGIGIKNIKRRLDILYGNDSKLEISTKDGIFAVCMTLSLTITDNDD